jgi:hypothetical protein
VLHPVGILFTHLNDDARSKSHQIYTDECYGMFTAPYYARMSNIKPDLKKSAQWMQRSKSTLHKYYKEILYQTQRREGEEGLEVKLHALLKSQHYMEIISLKTKNTLSLQNRPPPLHWVGVGKHLVQDHAGNQIPTNRQ